MDTIKNIFIKRPALVAWLVLSLGMVAILVWEARDVGLQGSQWFWLIAITVGVAGLCIAIISWGDDEADLDADPDQAAG